MNNKTRAANIRWFGLPNPTPLEKQQIKAARLSYAAKNNIDQRKINLSNQATLINLRNTVRQMYPPPLPVIRQQQIIPAQQNQIPFVIELQQKRAKILPPPQPKQKVFIQTRINKLIEFKKQQAEIKRRSNDPSINLNKVDVWRGFNRSTYKVNNINSLEGFYQTYKELAGKQQNMYAILRILNPDPSQPDVYRTITPENMQTMADFLSITDGFSKGLEIGRAHV